MTYKGLITRLEPNEIFVFGSNTQGRHGKGAALTALQKFGAIYGQAKGLQGQSYAIVTKDLTKSVHPSISKEDIIGQLKDLMSFADSRRDLTFYIAYSGNGVNLNGYTNQAMADMFKHFEIPTNIIFEEDFNKLLHSNM